MKLFLLEYFRSLDVLNTRLIKSLARRAALGLSLNSELLHPRSTGRLSSQDPLILMLLHYFTR